MLYYNTDQKKLEMPEYGRNVLKMIEHLKEIEDRDKRNEQAKAIVKAMELINPQVRAQENFRNKLWNHLFVIGGFDLDVDSPYPRPTPEEFTTKPVPLPMKGTKIKANHYGRNIEKIIDLIAGEPDGPLKSSMIHATATYMRQQYLIWNKDSVADGTIFADLEKLSDGRIKVPEGMVLGAISDDATFSRPSIGGSHGRKNQHRRKHYNK